MAKAHIFKKRNAHRYRKIYNYIRRKPIDQYTSDTGFSMIVGQVTFQNTSEAKFEYATSSPDIVFKTVPIITAIAVDSESNNSANVNIFISQVSTTEVRFESSAPFNGTVNFQVISQD